MHGLPDNKLRIKTIIRGYAMGLHNLHGTMHMRAGPSPIPKKSGGIMRFGVNSPNLHACMLLVLLIMGKGD